MIYELTKNERKAKEKIDEVTNFKNPMQRSFLVCVEGFPTNLKSRPGSTI